MSEIIIKKANNEDNVVAFSPAKVSVLSTYENVLVENEKLASVSEFQENSVLSGENVNSTNNKKDVSDPSVTDDLESHSENDKKRNSHNVTVDIDTFYQDIPVLTSTPVMPKEENKDSRHASDKTPLLKECSSATSSCSNLTTGGNETAEASHECSYLEDSDHSSLNNISVTSKTKDNLMLPGSIRVPIVVGHEVVEARSKFTVFKIHVTVEDDDVGWFIFRRYSDFVHANDQLKVLYPNFRLSLPPKRWFRSNFDSDFLEERVLGLQAFVNNITGHKDICNSKPVRDFFCFDNPPGPHDSLEESRAQCESMEDALYLLRRELSEKETEIKLLNEELSLYKNQVQLLTSRLSALNRRSNFERSGSEKHSLSAGTGKFGINTLLGSENQQLTNNLDTESKCRSQEQ